jgi:hypothetical protein
MLISGTEQIQFQRADAPALSADGRYAVFQGILADVPGVYRRNLQSGAVQLVAREAGAGAPSISGDGRYVAFMTAADLNPSEEPAADEGCFEVYVRDMEREPKPNRSEEGDSEPAYTLASALDGTTEGITFACSAEGGAQVAPDGAISEDGRQVAFTVLDASNIARGPHCSEPTPLAQCPPEIEPSQVAVRDLERHTTTLVSVTPGGLAASGGGVTPAGLPVPGGGAYPSDGELSGRIEEELPYGDERSHSTAVISADGSTVAWLGTNISQQVAGGEGWGTEEVEPLWRRIGDGPAARTVRLLAGSGLNLGFNFGQERSVKFGSLLGLEMPLFIPPAISRDGSAVAVIANAPTAEAQASYGEMQNRNLERPDTDAYVVHVTPAPAYAPHVTALTATPSYAASGEALWPIKDIAISPSGEEVAFDTARSEFTLPSLALISPPFPDLNKGAVTFEANVALGTLQRVTTTYNGAEQNGQAGLLAFSGDGQTLAFASQASNLIFGDGVHAWEIYLAHDVPIETRTAPQVLGEAPPALAVGIPWLLSATAHARPDGSVLVSAQVPGAGQLVADTQAQVPTASSSHSPRPASRPRRLTHARARRAGARAAGRRANGRSSQSVRAFAPRTIAQAEARADGPVLLQLRLSIPARYRSLLASAHGLYALVRLSFSAAGHAALVQEIPVTIQISTRKRTRSAVVQGTRRHSARHGAARVSR